MLTQRLKVCCHLALLAQLKAAGCSLIQAGVEGGGWGVEEAMALHADILHAGLGA